MLTPDEFERLTAALYRQFGWRASDAERMEHIADRYKLLKETPRDILSEAVSKLLSSESRMPTIHALKQACADVAYKRSGQHAAYQEPHWPDTNKCRCGCAGARWAKLLPSTAEYPDVRRTRDFLSCIPYGFDPIPPSARFLENDERGVPIYDVHEAYCLPGNTNA